jgi:cytidine deaminase
VPSAGLAAPERPVSDQPDPIGPGVGQANAGRADFDWANVDWNSLRRAADEVATHAYAPYSRLRVGAAGLCEDGHVVTGCNVENASFGLTLCAECGLVADLVARGCTRLAAVSVTAGDGRPLTPCGRCRQVLMEHGGPGLLLDGGPGAPPQRLGDLLPGAFDDAELVSRRSPNPERQPGQRRLPEGLKQADQTGQPGAAG